MTLGHEYHARAIVQDRLAAAERHRFARRARAVRRREVRVWSLGALVVAWRPRPARADLGCEPHLVLWV